MPQLLKLIQDVQLGRHGRCVYHQRMPVRGLESIVNQREIVGINNIDTFCTQLLCQRGLCLIIATHQTALMTEITGQCTHANATNSDEVNLSDIVYVHFSMLSKLIKPASMLGEISSFL